MDSNSTNANSRNFTGDSRKAPVPNPRARSDPKHLARVEEIRRQRQKLVERTAGNSTRTANINSLLVPSIATAERKPSVATISMNSSVTRADIAAPKTETETINMSKQVPSLQQQSPEFRLKTSIDLSKYDDVSLNYGSAAKSRKPAPIITKPLPVPKVTSSSEPERPYLPLSGTYRTELLKILHEMTAKANKTGPSRDCFLTDDGYYSWLNMMDGSVGEDFRFPSLISDIIRSWDITKPLDTPFKMTDNKTSSKPTVSTTLKLVAHVKQARDLPRDSKDRPVHFYAVIEYPDCKTKEVKMYETAPSTVPEWDQEITLNVNSFMEPIVVAVYSFRETTGFFGDNTKENLLGMVKINVQTIVADAAKQGISSRWYPLQSSIGDARSTKSLAEGELLLEFEMSDVITTTEDGPKTNHAAFDSGRDKIKKIQHLLVSHRVNFKNIYCMLVDACVSHDLAIAKTMALEDIDIDQYDCKLSKDSESLLGEFAKFWAIGDMFKKMQILKSVFDLYKQQRVHSKALLIAYRVIYVKVFKQGSVWLPSYEQPILFTILSDIEAYVTDQIRNYDAFFPCDVPLSKTRAHHITSSLNSLLLLTRMIDKNPFFLEKIEDPVPPNTEDIKEGEPCVKIGISDLDYKNGKFSFKEKIHGIIQTKMIANFQRLNEMTSNVDGNETVAGSLLKCVDLAKHVINELEQDRRAYRKGFLPEIDILPISVRAYVPNLMLEIHNMARLVKREMKTQSVLFMEDVTGESLSTSSLVSKSTFGETAPDSPVIRSEEDLIGLSFDLMEMMRELERNLDKYNLPADIQIDLEHISTFTPFIFRWLELTELKTVEWVENAINLDKFVKQPNSNCSSSVTDLFSAIFSALEYLQNKIECWKKYEIHYSLFITRFSQIAYKAIKYYCQRLESVSDEFELEGDENQVEPDKLSKILGWIQNPEDQQQTSGDATDPVMKRSHAHLCMLMCNLEETTRKLRTLYKAMDGSQMVIAAEKWRKRKEHGKSRNDMVTGILKVKIISAENLKSKSGLMGTTRPYVVIRRISETEHLNTEVARSHCTQGVNSIFTHLNPRTSRSNYKKSFPFMKEPAHHVFPVVDAAEVEVDVYHRSQSNLFSFISSHSDTLLGRGSLKLSRAELWSNKTDHFYWIDLNTQGRVLAHLEFLVEGVAGLDRSMAGADGISFGLGGVEDVDYWFLKMEACVDSVRTVLVNEVVDDFHATTTNEIAKIVQKASIQNDVSAVQISADQADSALSALAIFLNNNLGVFSSSLPANLSQYVVYNIWRRAILFPFVQHLYPTTYHGQSSTLTSMFQGSNTQKQLDGRQKNMVVTCLQLLVNFFYADGDDLGIPVSLLKTCSGFIPAESKRNKEISKDLFAQN